DRPAVLVTPYPAATRNWSGWLDGHETPLLEINGGFLGVKVPPGPHTGSVRYLSERPGWGYRIFFRTLHLAARAFVRRAVRDRPGGDDRRGGGRARTAALGLLLATSATLAYAGWERGFRARAWKPAVLNHDYPELLRIQAERWRDAARPDAGLRAH